MRDVGGPSRGRLKRWERGEEEQRDSNLVRGLSTALAQSETSLVCSFCAFSVLLSVVRSPVYTTHMDCPKNTSQKALERKRWKGRSGALRAQGQLGSRGITVREGGI